MNATTPTDEALAADPDKPAVPIRIVIADDHPIFRDGLQKLLSVEKDFEVVAVVGDGDEVFRTGDDRSTPGPRNGRVRERSPLSQREREIVGLVAQGFKNKEMAQKMFISEQTVKNHLHNIFDKLGVSDRLELALYAIHKKLHLG